MCSLLAMGIPYQHAPEVSIVRTDTCSCFAGVLLWPDGSGRLAARRARSFVQPFIGSLAAVQLWSSCSSSRLTSSSLSDRFNLDERGGPCVGEVNTQATLSQFVARNRAALRHHPFWSNGHGEAVAFGRLQPTQGNSVSQSRIATVEGKQQGAATRRVRV